MENILRKDQEIENLWEEFGNVPFDSQNYRILNNFYTWQAGTDKDTIWGWFNNNHSKGIYYLMNEYESK